MGQKVNPHGLRVGVIKDWDSKWYADGDFAEMCIRDSGRGCHSYRDLTHHQSGDCCTAWCCFGESKTASGEREQPGSDGTDHPYRASVRMRDGDL